jgi:hypothetical protein
MTIRLALICLTGFLVFEPNWVIAGSADLFQARNGAPNSPTDPVDWVKGNVGQANSHYIEGYSIPYRIVMSGLANGSHKLIIEWDVTQSGKHAVDYLAHYNRLLPHNYFPGHSQPETIDVLNGLTGSFSSPQTFPIPPPSNAGSPVAGLPTTSFNSLSNAERVLTIWNGTVTNATYLSEGNPGLATASTRMLIEFTTSVGAAGTVVIALGGHIATSLDWGLNNAATGISGSSYHMRLISLDGGGGNQDRSLQATAIIFAPSCSIVGPAIVCPGTVNSYSAVTDATGAVYGWSLTNNTGGATIIGPTNGSSVQIQAGGGALFTVQVNITPGVALSSASQCQTDVVVNRRTTSTALQDQKICPRSTVIFATSPSGTGPFSFAWRKDGNLIDGATNSSLQIANVSNAAAGRYCVEVTGACNSVTNCATLTLIPPPVITCPPDLLVQCLTDVPLPDPGSLLATTESGSVVVSYVGDTVITNGCDIIITRGYKATDSCGSETPCAQIITIRDTQPPAITCPSDRVVELGLEWHFDWPTAYDACDGTNVAISVFKTVTNRLCGNSYSATRTWQATDRCLNSSACSQTITIADSQAPTINCAGPKTIEIGSAWNFDPPTASDIGDGNVTITIVSTLTNNLCGNTFSAIRTWRATDGCSNSVTCSQTVTIADTQPPTIICVGPKTIEIGGTWDFDAPTASDIGDGTNVTITIVSTLTNNLCGNTFSTVRTWRATDGCSNSVTCSQTVTIADTEPPTINCADPKTVEFGNAWDFDAPTASDIGDGTNVTITVFETVTNSLVGNLFSAKRTWKATDGCSNSASCSQTVTLLDTTAPQITCPTNITVACQDPTGVTVQFTGSASDIADPTVQTICTPASGSVFPLGVNNVKCVATDLSGNQSQCSFTVTVVDLEPPTISCPGNIIVSEDPPGSGQAVVTYPSATATDKCDLQPSISYSPAPGSPLPVGDNNILCTARDASGNSNTCSFVIRVVPRTIVTSSTEDSGPGTLRQALLDANDVPGDNIINFGFQGQPPYVIKLLSPLPPISDSVIIDGWSCNSTAILSGFKTRKRALTLTKTDRRNRVHVCHATRKPI